MAPEFEPQEIPATDLAAHAVESIRELRKQRLIQWGLRSAITGTLLWWLGTKYGWAKVVFYIWAVFAVISLLVLVFLPAIVGNRIRALENKMTEGLDLAGMAGMPGMDGRHETPRDVEVDDVSDVEAEVLGLPGTVPNIAPVPLEEQLDELASFGITLSEGVSVTEICHSVERSELEAAPYGPLIHLLGSEVERGPSGRPFASSVWSFDAACIEGEGSYVEIVEKIARVTGKVGAAAELEDSFDGDRGVATLSYRLNGMSRKFRPPITDDWADPATVQSVIDDFTDVDRGLFGIAGGQVTTMICLDREEADRFRALIGEELMELA